MLNTIQSKSMAATIAALTTPRDAIGPRFDAYRDELDEHNDRRERLVKVRLSLLHSLYVIYAIC